MCFLRCRISPMSFAILRIQKLKSFADVGGSLSHNYRNRETLNADDLKMLSENQQKFQKTYKHTKNNREKQILLSNIY